MAPRATQTLDVQAQSLIDAADAAARWFRRPGPEALSAARGARAKARAWNPAAGALAEAVEFAAQGVSDAALWDIGADAHFAAMSEALRDGSSALARASRASGAARAEALTQAKAFAAAVERGRRAVLNEAQSSTYFIDSVKRSEIASRLSASAEALQQACDELAGSLSE